MTPIEDKDSLEPTIEITPIKDITDLEVKLSSSGYSPSSQGNAKIKNTAYNNDSRYLNAVVSGDIISIVELTGYNGENNTHNEAVNMDNNQFNATLFKELKDDLRERETRQRQEISEREARFEKQLTTFNNDAKEREERIIKSMSELENKLDQFNNSFESIKSQNFWGNIALFIGMLAIVITLIIFALAQ